MVTNLKIVFLGSPDFALPTLNLIHKNHDVVGVVTQPDRAAGRGRELKPPPVKSLALELDIPVIQPQKIRDEISMDQLRVWSPSLIIVAAYGQILKQEVLEMPEFGCLNIHASLLPRWRGAAPINAAILHGDDQSGITIMKMNAGLDTGPILSQESVRIKSDETAGSLFESLSQLGAKLLLETLPDYISGELMTQSQSDQGVTYAGMLKKQDGELVFSYPAEQLERKIRAFNPWPGTYFQWNGDTLKVHRASIGTGKASEAERIVVADKPGLGTSNGLLILEEVQAAGKKRMPAKDFLRGIKNWAG